MRSPMSGSLYEYLRQSARAGYRQRRRDLSGRGRPGKAAGILGIPVGSPVFVVERVGFAGTRRVEWTLSTVAGEGYEVHVHLRR